jgi:hypothetical protein
MSLSKQTDSHIDFQELSREIAEQEGFISCVIIDQKGNVRGRIIGILPDDRDLWESAGEIAAVIWGGLMKVEPMGGPIVRVTAEFEKFKIVGVPIAEYGLAALVGVTNETESTYVRDRVLSHVQAAFASG